jgi:hypothetical protein
MLVFTGRGGGEGLAGKTIFHSVHLAVDGASHTHLISTASRDEVLKWAESIKAEADLMWPNPATDSFEMVLNHTSGGIEQPCTLCNSACLEGPDFPGPTYEYLKIKREPRAVSTVELCHNFP